MSNFKKPCTHARRTVLQSALIAAFTIAALAPATSMAQATNDPGHWQSSSGIVWKNSSGLCWRSGTWTPDQATAECEPELMKKAEIPAPVEVAEVAPPPPPAPRMQARKVSFLAEELFDFDKAELKPEGKVALDSLASELSGVENESIAVTGHADRIGSSDYNQKLSEQRAQAVNTYLASKGVPQNQISSKGVGEAEPATKADDCQGAVNKKLIACLQPDRRVVVDVTGSKTIEVAATEGTAVSDADDGAITARVKEEIANEPTYQPRLIAVETYQGTVQLSGFVASQDEMDKAIEVARQVQGVTSVKSDIQIK